MPNTTTPRPITRALPRLLPLLALLGTACELKVTNPGPVQADFLDSPAALSSVVNGAGRDLSEALNWTAYTGAAVAKEIFPARIDRGLRHLRAPAGRQADGRRRQQLVEPRAARAMDGGAVRAAHEGGAGRGRREEPHARPGARVGRLRQPPPRRELLRGRHRRQREAAVDDLLRARGGRLHGGDRRRHGGWRRDARAGRDGRTRVGAPVAQQPRGRGGRRGVGAQRVRLPHAVLPERGGAVQPRLLVVGEPAVPRAHGVQHVLRGATGAPRATRASRTTAASRCRSATRR